MRRTDFNPRSSCEERLVENRVGLGLRDISIHAPHARSDSPYPSHLVPPARKFQSTLLMRGATRRFHQLLVRAILFQSTLLMRGATGSPSSMAGGTRNFNPRSSCEERPSWPRGVPGHHYFNPRSSCEERLSFAKESKAILEISIHAPHARSDWTAFPIDIEDSISIHAPHARSDREPAYIHVGGRNFNPRSSCEERRKDMR